MLKFTKDLETGVEKIDSQHKELINRINSLLTAGEEKATNDETRKTLDYLGEYVVKHFSDEEELQVASKYPKYPEHKQKHTAFIADFVKLKGEFDEKGNSTEFTMKLNDAVIVWIVRHIKGDDAEFGKYYRKQAS